LQDFREFVIGHPDSLAQMRDFKKARQNNLSTDSCGEPSFLASASAFCFRVSRGPLFGSVFVAFDIFFLSPLLAGEAPPGRASLHTLSNGVKPLLSKQQPPSS
jgi:hypothetical protein